jgi:hypothetical protein
METCAIGHRRRSKTVTSSTWDDNVRDRPKTWKWPPSTCSPMETIAIGHGMSIAATPGILWVKTWSMDQRRENDLQYTYWSMETDVIGHGNLKMVLPVFGYGNVVVGQKSPFHNVQRRLMNEWRWTLQGAGWTPGDGSMPPTCLA